MTSRPAAAAGGAEPGARPGSLGGTLVRNTLWTVGARLVFLAGWAILTPFLLTLLGPERFAIWALFFALTGYFAVLDFGLSQALVKFVAEFTAAGDRRALRGLVTLATGLYLVLGAVAVAVLAAAREPLLAIVNTPPALHHEAGRALVVMAGALALGNLVSVAAGVFAGRQRMDLSNRLLVLVTAMQLVGTVMVLARGGGLVALGTITLAAQAIGAATGVAMLRRHVPELTLERAAVSRPLFAAVARYGLALQVTNLGTLAQFQLDKLLLAHFVALHAVTPYELGFRLAHAAWFAPVLMLPPLVPAFAHLAASGEHERLVRLYRRAARYVAALSYPLAAFVAVAAPSLVTAWLGPGHAEAARATLGLSLLLWLTLHTGVATAALRGLGRPEIEARFHGLAFALHLAASLWAVPRFGLDGALASTIGSTAIAAVWLLRRFHREIGESSRAWARASLTGPLAWSLVAAAVTLGVGRLFAGAPVDRMQALIAIARDALVFAAVIGLGYGLTGTVRIGEFRRLATEGSAGGDSIAPR